MNARNARLLNIENWEKLANQAGFEPGKMAALCPISLRQMERFFARYFGKTPEEWMLDLKCRLAKELIARGYSTKAVAAEFRFASESHFCHQFKKAYGTSPQSFAPFYRHGPHMSFKSNNVV